MNFREACIHDSNTLMVYMFYQAKGTKEEKKKIKVKPQTNQTLRTVQYIHKVDEKLTSSIEHEKCFTYKYITHRHNKVQLYNLFS